MDQCIQRQVDNGFLLMGWLNVSTGETRQWRCSSLKHMMEDRRPVGPHDPFVDVDGFMRCADRVVSYGFPRPGDPGNTRYILQYHGTNRTGNVIVNDATSDIASIYTAPNNDWHECAFWTPSTAAQDDGERTPNPWQMTDPATHAAAE